MSLDRQLPLFDESALAQKRNRHPEKPYIYEAIEILRSRGARVRRCGHDAHRVGNSPNTSSIVDTKTLLKLAGVGSWRTRHGKRALRDQSHSGDT
jgi:hypothetical protein